MSTTGRWRTRVRPPLQRATKYDIYQEQMRHNDALNWFGEMNCYLLWWNAEDYANGLTVLCSECQNTGDQIQDDIAAAYGQADQKKCATCYGTTFEGGLRAIRYRPTIWQTSDRDDDVKKRGFVNIDEGTIQFAYDLILRKGDIVVRPDGSRWEISTPSMQEVSTGFGSQQNNLDLVLGMNARVIREDDVDVSYLPNVDFTALTITGHTGTVNWNPHPLDQDAPDPAQQLVPPPKPEVDPTDGWLWVADTTYIDYATSLPVLASTPTILPNDGGSRIDTEVPVDGVNWWDGVSSKFTPSRANERFSIETSFSIRSPIAGRTVRLEVYNPTLGVIMGDLRRLSPNAGVDELISYSFDVVALPDHISSGLFLRIEVDGIASVWGVSTLIQRTHDIEDGYLQVSDTTYSTGSPQTILSSTPSAILNNGGTRNDANAPAEAATWWDNVDSFFPTAEGEVYDFNLTFYARTAVAGRRVNIDARTNGIPFRGDSRVLEEAGVAEEITFSGSMSIDAGMVINGIEWFLTANDNIEVWGASLLLTRKYVP